MRVHTLVIRDDAAAPGYPYSPFASQPAGQPVSEARSEWFPTFAIQPYGHAHVFLPSTLVHNGTTVLGIHNTANLCRKQFSNWATDHRSTSWSALTPGAANFDRNLNVFAHELGHGFNIRHSGLQGNFGLMSRTVGGGFLFHPVDLAIALDWIATASNCYVAGTSNFGPPTVGSIAPSTVAFYPVSTDFTILGSELGDVYQIEIDGQFYDRRHFDVIHGGRIDVHGFRGHDVGTHPVVVTSPGGSASINLTVAPVSSPVLEVNTDPILGFVAMRTLAEPNGFAYRIFSFDPSEWTLLGWPLLVNRLPVSSGFDPLDSNGDSSNLRWTPDATLIYPGTTVWTQSAVYSPGAAFTGTTNIVPTMIYR